MTEQAPRRFRVRSVRPAAGDDGRRRADLSARRRRKPRIIVLVGLPGSGKSTWAARQNLPVLSSDAMRGLLADDITDQTIHRLVFASIRFLLRMRLRAGRPVTCIDATHLTPRERRPYLRLPGCRVEAVYFDVPPEICKQRNRQRDRTVPEQVIDEMAAKLVRPSRSEGFSRILIVTPEGDSA